MNIPHDMIQQIASSVVTTRDMCGNEAEALVDACLDMGVKPLPEVTWAVQDEVERQWDEYRRQAGVL